MKEIELIQSIKIPISEVENNIGQIPGVKSNPREMTEMEFRKLKKSLKRDAQMTAISELKLFPYNGKWVAIGGNMRLQAMRELGWKEVIAKPIPADTDAETLERYILIDNASFGKWDFDKLANEWSIDLLNDICIEIPPIEIPKDDKEDTPNEVEQRCQVGDIWQISDSNLICGSKTKECDMVLAYWEKISGMQAEYIGNNLNQ